MSNKQLARKQLRSSNRGFSLLELMVTITIVTLITAIVMIRYSAFDSSILLNNQAFELALDIRETQVRSISVQASDSSDTNFASNFGLYFDKSADENDQYIFFRDNTAASGVGRYSNAAEQIGQPFTIDSRFYISDIYINNSPSSDMDNVSVLFQRPNFDARFGFSPAPGGSVSSVHIVIASRRNPSATRSVSVYSSGLITVD